MIQVLPRGQGVLVAGIPGIIKAVMIEGDIVSYKVAYFNGATYCEVWLIRSEFSLSDVTMEVQAIGFKK